MYRYMDGVLRTLGQNWMTVVRMKIWMECYGQLDNVEGLYYGFPVGSEPAMGLFGCSLCTLKGMHVLRTMARVSRRGVWQWVARRGSEASVSLFATFATLDAEGIF